jgi:hypothetical protein
MNALLQDPFVASGGSPPKATLTCCVEGCMSTFTTDQPLAPHARFICRYHTKRVQKATAFQPYAFDRDLGGRTPEGTDHIPNTNNSSMGAQLRKQFDSKEPFMTGRADSARGFGEKKIVKPPRYSETPKLLFDDELVKQLLYAKFPGMLTIEKQKTLAARWLGVIRMYFRLSWPAVTVAQELGVTGRTVERDAWDIRKFCEGLNSGE